MQSILPAISASLKIADIWVSIAFSWSALLWVVMAPRWARASDRRGRKALMKMGIIGFSSSMGFCALVLWLGLNGFISATITFILFAAFRSLYGGFGSAAPPAVQAYVAARTERQERTRALTLLASSFGLGTVIGPSVAHLLVLPPFGLAGPMVMFTCFGLAVLAALVLRLPDDTPRFAARGNISAFPTSGTVGSTDQSSENEPSETLPRSISAALDWRDPRISRWLMAGLLSGHAQAILLGVTGFLVRDRLGLHEQPRAAVAAIGSVMFTGALATLVAQWGLIPMLSLKPKPLVIWGALLALIGITIVATSHSLYPISTGYALASLGFGLVRPGFTAGASLAVRKNEQGDVAGKIASIAGGAYIFAPALGVWIYSIWEPGTFLMIGMTLLFLILWGKRTLEDV